MLWLLLGGLLVIMSFVPRLQRVFGRLGLANDNATSASSSSTASEKSNNAGDSSSARGTYEPSAMDVHIAKMMLQNGLSLPVEVVLSIFDFADYWPHTTAKLDSSLVVTSGQENQFILRTRPLGFIKRTHNDPRLYARKRADPISLPQDAEYSLEQFQKWIGGPTDIVQHPCRKIVFTIKSRDQGWSNNARQDRGSYRGSYTWFEAGLERFDKTATRPKDNADEEEAPIVPTDMAEEKGESSVATSSQSKEEDHELPGYSEREPPAHPFLPVYALRSIYPTVNEQLNPPQFHHGLLAFPENTIQFNKTATREVTTHKVVWSWTDNVNPLTAEQLEEIGRGPETGKGEFVRNLKPGDVISVWAKSRFGGWANHVEDVKVDVYWAL